MTTRHSSYDPHSVYGYDPETGVARTPARLKPIVCRGCGDDIANGAARMVTVQRAAHVITVPAHDGHQEAARANALQDTSWQRDASHYAG